MKRLFLYHDNSHKPQFTDFALLFVSWLIIFTIEWFIEESTPINWPPLKLLFDFLGIGLAIYLFKRYQPTAKFYFLAFITMYLTHWILLIIFSIL